MSLHNDSRSCDYFDMFDTDLTVNYPESVSFNGSPGQVDILSSDSVSCPVGET